MNICKIKMYPQTLDKADFLRYIINIYYCIDGESSIFCMIREGGDGATALCGQCEGHSRASVRLNTDVPRVKG